MGAVGTFLGSVARAFGSLPRLSSVDKKPGAEFHHLKIRPSFDQKSLHRPNLSSSESILARFANLGSGIYRRVFNQQFQKLQKLLLVDPNIPAFDINKLKVDSYEEINLAEDADTNHKSIKFYLPAKDADTAVLVYGARSTARKFGKLAENLHKKGHGVLLGDIAGYGVNSGITLSEANMITDVALMIDKASKKSNGKAVNIIGHSLGAANSLAAIEKIFKEEEETGHFDLKIKRLVLISIWKDIETLVSDQLEPDEINQSTTKLEKIISGLDQNEKIKDFLAANLHKAPEIAQAMFAKEWNASKTLQNILDLNSRRPEEFKIRAIDFCHGKDDPFVKYERAQELHELVKTHRNAVNSSFNLMNEGGHFDFNPNKYDFSHGLEAKILQIIDK